MIYTTHVKNDGWLGNSFNGEQSGTTGQNKHVEALMLKLTGKDADKYDIYYRVHAQNYGWLAWAKTERQQEPQDMHIDLKQSR